LASDCQGLFCDHADQQGMHTAARSEAFATTTMNDFTPLSALLGGLLIGLACLCLLATTGRLAGISGMVFGACQALFQRDAAQARWRLGFLGGLMAGGWLMWALAGQPVPERQHFHPAWLVVGGLLAGWGTSQANGCTSGHGVCGIGRLSARSVWATVTFMGTGVLTVWVMRHAWGVQ
jgi:uncharacterized membrane protein YedE/YeeE